MASLRDFLILNDFALVIGRDLTRRDGADRQQPRNLRAGSAVTRADAGKLYDISHVQFFQGDLIRGYSNAEGPVRGRRVLAQAMHSVGANPVDGGPAGSVAIGDDGSVAAFVPAGRALSWQTVDPAGKAVVRERYWLTFQKGEIRVCGSCHGVNRVDQAGGAEPANPPQALFRLLEHWKGLDHSAPLPTPVAAPPLGGYGVVIRSNSGRPIRSVGRGRSFVVRVRGPHAGERLALDFRSHPARCQRSLADVRVAADGTAVVRVRAPSSSVGVRYRFVVSRSGVVVARSSVIAVTGGARSQQGSICPTLRARQADL